MVRPAGPETRTGDDYEFRRVRSRTADCWRRCEWTRSIRARRTAESPRESSGDRNRKNRFLPAWFHRDARDGSEGGRAGKIVAGRKIAAAGRSCRSCRWSPCGSLRVTDVEVAGRIHGKGVRADKRIDARYAIACLHSDAGDVMDDAVGRHLADVAVSACRRSTGCGCVDRQGARIFALRAEGPVRCRLRSRMYRHMRPR